MEPLTLEEIVKAVRGRLVHGGRKERITGVSIDSRKVRPGDLFFAFPGARYDGHDFVGQALEAGAAAAVVTRPVKDAKEKPLILVSDPLDALQGLARYYRRLFNIPVVGVTGSTGKTTTKDIIAGVLGKRWRVLKNEGNYNNEIGLPLTLLRMERSHQVAVLEMAMRGRGEIAALCEIGRPQVGVITNIGKTHLELLGSQEAIAKAKGELLEALPSDGCAVLNAEDPWQLRLASRVRRKVIFYGMDENCAVRASDITLQELEGVKFLLRTPSGEVPCFLPIPGRHNVYNALAAAAVGHYFGLTPEEIASGLGSPSRTGMRLEVMDGVNGIKIIDDSYNASPASVRAALELLAAVSGRRKIAVLGDMYELGAESLSGHREVGEKAALLHVDCLCAVGELARETAAGAAQAGLPPERIHVFQKKEEAAAFLQSFLSEGDIVLIKGSRGMRMEEITEFLTKRSDVR
jgi:UDP-N-acetylmuramoyl-tripeptide--D-alanyl-D-alanine ligase